MAVVVNEITKQDTGLYPAASHATRTAARRSWPRVYFRSRAPHPTGGHTDTGNAAPTPSLLLTVPEACAVLRVSRWTLYRLIQERQLDTIKIRGRRCVPVASIHTLIERLRDGEGV